MQNLFDELQGIVGCKMAARNLFLVSEALSKNESLLRANKIQETTQKEQRTSSTVKTSACTRHGRYDRDVKQLGFEVSN